MDRTRIRNSVTNILANELYSSRPLNPAEKRMKKKISNTKKFLKANQEVLVLNADKSNVTVIMEETEYNFKMEELLNDDKTYMEIKKDITETIQRKTNEFISNWVKKSYISNQKGTELHRYNSVISKIYGLPKTHKNDCPLRPIVSCVNSATYNISRFFTTILSNVIGKTDSFVKNSDEMRKELLDLRIPPNHLIISLDVVSLFTCIPNDLVIHVVEENWTEISIHSPLPKDEFVKGLKYVMNNCVFAFRSRIFKEVSGFPMGSPVSPVLANVVMEYIEEKVLQGLDFRPVSYKRYVDDIFAF
jgi:hypothetical protein